MIKQIQLGDLEQIVSSYIGKVVRVDNPYPTHISGTTIPTCDSAFMRGLYHISHHLKSCGKCYGFSGTENDPIMVEQFHINDLLHDACELGLIEAGAYCINT